MGDRPFEVIIDGGGPWGFRLQGGKDFGVPLKIARVTPGSKSSTTRMNSGDFVLEINGNITENLSHMEAQNIIKQSGQRLTLKLKKGNGAGAEPKVLTETTVVHSAKVDHAFNSKPRAFGSPASSAPAPVAAPISAPKFDPAAYARKKKEELEQRKKEQNATAADSEILKMINATHISQNQPPPPPPPPPQQAAEDPAQAGGDPGAFRMVYSGRDIHEEASPGSKSVISSLKEKVSQDKSGLNSESKVPSRVFQMLQKQLDQEDPEDDDLPPPPPELIDEEEPPRPSFGSSGPGVQSRTFRHLQEAVESGEGHQSVFSRPPEERNKAVPMPSQKPKPVAASQPQVTTVNAIPKPPMPSGPNFKISSPKAPSFKAASPYQQNSYRPTSNAPAYNNTPSAPSFKPSTVPQPVNAPQTTTNKAPSKAPLPIDPSRVPVCQSCNENIRGPFVSAIGKTWHPEHFCCDSCKVSLQNQQFVEEENKLYCQKCFANFAPSCSSCGETIIGNCVNAIGKSFHPDCFVCKSCKKHFANEGFMVEMGDPYCDKCHDRCFGVHCTGCDRTITGGQRYVEALGQNWHSDCFTCRKCQTRLEGSTFFVVDNRPFCGLHKSGV